MRKIEKRIVIFEKSAKNGLDFGKNFATGEK